MATWEGKVIPGLRVFHVHIVCSCLHKTKVMN